MSGFAGRVGEFHPSLPGGPVAGGGPGKPAVRGEPRRACLHRASDRAPVVSRIELHVGDEAAEDSRPGRPRGVVAAEQAAAGGGQHHSRRCHRDAIDEGEIRDLGGGKSRPGHAVRRREDAVSLDGVDVPEALTGARIDRQGISRVHRDARAGEVAEEIVDRRPGGTAVLGVPYTAADAGRPHPAGVARVDHYAPDPAADVTRAEPLPGRHGEPGLAGSRRRRGGGSRRHSRRLRGRVGHRRDVKLGDRRLHRPLWRLGAAVA